MLDDELMATLRQRVEELRDRRWESVSYEIQDDGFFLIVTIHVAVSQSEKENLDEILRLLCQLLKELVPRRPDTYAWMIRIELLHGKFMKSIMGGAVGRPDDPPEEE